MSGMEEVTRQLRMAVYGNAHDEPENAAHDFEHLLWEVGEFRRRAEDAHSALDLMGVPRERSGVLTLRGRLDLLRDEVVR